MSTIQVGPIEIGYDDASSGPPVVFLHGFPFNRSMWLEQFGALVQEYRVVALDLRGLGQTTATTEPATMEAMAGDVVAVLDALSISRAVICGLSMGGYVALALCRAFPLGYVRSCLPTHGRLPMPMKSDSCGNNRRNRR